MSTVPHSRAKSSRTVAVFAGVVSLAVAASLAVAGASLAKAGHSNAADDTVETPSLGCGSAEVTSTLDTGSAWRMCARIDPIKGLVLGTGAVPPGHRRPRVPGLAAGGRLRVPGPAQRRPTTPAMSRSTTSPATGSATPTCSPQTDQTCLGQTMPSSSRTCAGSRVRRAHHPGHLPRRGRHRPGLASAPRRTAPTATQYAQQGHALEVTSLTKISWYEYQQKVTLTDQGTITVGLGATGDLAPGSTFFPEDPAARLADRPRERGASQARRVALAQRDLPGRLRHRFRRRSRSSSGTTPSPTRNPALRVEGRRHRPDPGVPCRRRPRPADLVAGAEPHLAERGRAPSVLRDRQRLHAGPLRPADPAQGQLHQRPRVPGVRVGQPQRRLPGPVGPRLRGSRDRAAHRPGGLGQRRLPPHRPRRGPVAHADPLAGVLPRPARPGRPAGHHTDRAVLLQRRPDQLQRLVRRSQPGRSSGHDRSVGPEGRDRARQ